MNRSQLKTRRRPRLGVDARVIDDRYHGIGRCTFEVLRELAKLDRFEVVLFTSRLQSSARLDLASLVDECGFATASFDLPMTAISQQYFWPKALRRAGIDISLFPYHLSAPLFGGGRRNVIVHDCIFEEDPKYAPDRKTRELYRLLTRAIVRRTHVLTPSVASAQQITKHYGVKVGAEAVLPWGVTPHKAAVASGDSTAKLLPLPQKYYLHVGAHRPHKNVDLLIRAMAEYETDEHLVLVGAEDERWPSAAIALARTLGVAHRLVRLTSVTEAQLAQLYAGATAFLYPSLVEGFGLPLLEAMSAGVPVIASDIPVFREVAADAALLVPPNNLPAWTNALKQLSDPDARQVLVGKGRRRAEEATWERAAIKLADALVGPRTPRL